MLQCGLLPHAVVFFFHPLSSCLLSYQMLARHYQALLLLLWKKRLSILAYWFSSALAILMLHCLPSSALVLLIGELLSRWASLDHEANCSLLSGKMLKGKNGTISANCYNRPKWSKLPLSPDSLPLVPSRRISPSVRRCIISRLS